GNEIVIDAYGTGANPILDGDNNTPGDYVGIITVKGDYVDIKNITVKNSSGYCVEVYNSSGGTVENDMTNVTLETSWRSALRYRDVVGGTISGLDVSKAGKRRRDLGSGDWPAALYLLNSDSITVTGNTVHDNTAEGIGIYKGGNDNIVEKNLLYDNYSTSIYLANDDGSNTVRYNLIYGTFDSTYCTRYAGNWCGNGIAWSDEVESNPNNGGSGNKFHHNLIAATYACLRIAPRDPLSTATNQLWYNNTCVDTQLGIHIGSTNWAASGVEVKNNIFAAYDQAVDLYFGQSNPSGITFNYNNWDSQPPETYARGANDQNGDPLLATTSGWNSLAAGSVDGTGFALTEGSPGIDNGDSSIGASYDDSILTPDFTASPITVTLGDQDDYGPPGQATLQAEPDAEDLNPNLETDAYVQPTAGSQSWDIGAILASNAHTYTIWRLAEGDGVGDECDPTPTWTWETKSYTDLLSHVFSGLSVSTIYCWQAVLGNVAGDGAASAIDEFTTTGSAAGVEITISIVADKKVTFTLDTVGNKKATVTIRP
ncbi:MAG: right-handed parallel beta-helix repeat-containing protein, partial [Candidatus Thorarchaeota archaeon]